MRILALLATLALAAPAAALDSDPATPAEAARTEAASPQAAAPSDADARPDIAAASEADVKPDAPARTDADAKPATEPQPEAAATRSDTRCTADGVHCIAVKTYVADVCTTIERAATDKGLDPHFLARLLWKESLFEPSALSPKGAQGIAQFMPGTAQIVGLDDPFNPAKAIFAAAGYLRRLSDGFGNIGLAAVAYNGGEGRAQTFVAKGGMLPFETQDYVEAITGHNALDWRNNPPKTVDLRLSGSTPFRDACVTLAAKRTLKEFRTPERSWPWGVILASHPQQSGAARQVSTLNRQLRPILGGKRVNYVRKRLRGAPKPVYTAQIGYENRKQAAAFCVRLRQLGGKCIVLRN